MQQPCDVQFPEAFIGIHNDLEALLWDDNGEVNTHVLKVLAINVPRQFVADFVCDLRALIRELESSGRSRTAISVAVLAEVSEPQEELGTATIELRSDKDSAVEAKFPRDRVPAPSRTASSRRDMNTRGVSLKEPYRNLGNVTRTIRIRSGEVSAPLGLESMEYMLKQDLQVFSDRYRAESAIAPSSLPHGNVLAAVHIGMPFLQPVAALVYHNIPVNVVWLPKGKIDMPKRFEHISTTLICDAPPPPPSLYPSGSARRA